MNHKNRLTIIVVIILCVIGATVAAYLYLRVAGDTHESSNRTNSASPAHPLEAQTDRLSSNSDADDYIKDVSQGEVTLIKEQNVHDIPKINWQNQDVVAVQFSMYTARTFKSIELETIDGVETIVITIQEPSTNCPSAQIDELHAAFVAVPKDTISYPVAQRINATTPTECIR